MTTIANLRTTYLNVYLKRTDGDTLPWSDTDCNQALTDAMGDLWPDLGLRASGTATTVNGARIVTIPASIQMVTRIDVEDASGNQLDEVVNWRYHYDTDPPTKVLIRPTLQAGYTLRFFGWKPFADTGADLLTRLENGVAMKAAALCYGILAAQLMNSQRQQNLDSGRVVDYQTAVGMSAYWERRYQDGIHGDPNRPGRHPRASRR